MRELTRDYAVETVDTSSPFPESRRRHRPVAEMWIAERPGRGLIGVADLGRRQ